MAEDRDAQASPRSPVRRSTEEKQQKVPRPSRPDRAPRRLSPRKNTTARLSTGLHHFPDPRKDDIPVPPQFQSAKNPSIRDQSQPCARLRQLTTVDGGVALQRLYAIIQRQRDEWYESNCASVSPSPATATPQNINPPTTIGQPVNNQGRTSVTPGVASGGMAGLPSSDYTEPSRVTTPFTDSRVSEFSRVLTQNDQGQTTKMSESRQVTPPGSKENQSVRFQTPPVSPTDPMPLQTSGLVTTRGNLPFVNTPLQDISGGTLDSTALKRMSQDISGGTLESSTTQRQGLDISGGTLESGITQRQGQDISGGTLESGITQRQGQDISGGTLESGITQRQGQDISGGTRQSFSSQRTGQTDQFGYFQQFRQDAKGETPKSDSLQRLGSEQPAGNTQPTILRQSGTYTSGVVAQDPRGTLYSNASPQSGTQQSETSPPTQTFQTSGREASGCSCSCLARQSLQQRGSQHPAMVPHNPPLQQSATQPYPPPLPSCIQAQYHYSIPEAYCRNMSGVTMSEPSSNQDLPQQSPGRSSAQAPAVYLQHLPSSQSPMTPGVQIAPSQSPRNSGVQIASTQSPRTSGVQMSTEAPHEFRPSLPPAESGNQTPEGDSPKATGLPEVPPQQSPGPPTSEPLAKSDLVGEEFRGQDPTSNIHRQTLGSQVAPTAGTMDDPQTFERQVSAEFQILKELALSLKNIRYLPTPPPPPVGTAFENCVLAEIRSIRSRCAAYSQSGIYNQPNFFVQGTGSALATGPQNINQALEPPESSDGQKLPVSNQVNTFEQRVITALRSVNRSCEGGTNTNTITDQSQSSTTRLFEELVLSKLSELGKEFVCKQTVQPTFSGVEPAQPSQPNPEPVLPTTDPTSGTSGTRISQGGANRSSDPTQQDYNKPDEQSPQTNTTQNQSVSPGSGVDATTDQPMEPSYIRASSQGTTPFTGRIGSLTFDTTASSPAEINRTEQNDHVQNQAEKGREMNPAEDTLRRDTLDAEVLQQPRADGQRLSQPESGADGQRLSQPESRADQLPNPHPPSVTWADNDPTVQRICKGTQMSVQLEETIYRQPTFVSQRILAHPAQDNRHDRMTDECETGSIDDSDSDLDSIDSCSPRCLGFAHPPCVSPRQMDVNRKSNQTFLDCDYFYRASELAALANCRQRLSIPVKRPNWNIVGPCAPPDLTQYTMSETKPSQSPLVQDQQSITDPRSAYNRPNTSTRLSATIPLSSTLKEGHVQPTGITLPSELPSIIESERQRTTSTQVTISTGNQNESQVLQNRSIGQPCGGSSGPQQPLPLETGQGPRVSFDCSEIYYRTASNASGVDCRYRLGLASSGACGQLDQEAAEESVCWDPDPRASLRSGCAPMARDEYDCSTGSGLQRGRPCATSLESEGLRRKECGTPWPLNARPSGVRNRWPPLHALDCSGERLPVKRKTFTDSHSRRSSSKRGRRSYRKTSGLQPMDPRCRPKNAEQVTRTTLTNRMMNCMGVAPSRSKYMDDPCASSESETDCEF